MQAMPYKLKLNTKIGKYPAMSSMVICFKERNPQRRIWNCVKIAKLKYDKLAFLKELMYFKISRLKIEEKNFKMEERREQSGVVACI